VKYLLNVPLAVGALAQALFAYLALMSAPWPNWEDGPSRGAMAYIMFQPAVLSWLMMLIAGIPAVLPTRSIGCRSSIAFAGGSRCSARRSS